MNICKKTFSMVTISGLLLLFSCNEEVKHHTENSKATSSDATQQKVAGFPVTNYILGQIKIIEGLPVTLLEIITDGTKTDSVWIPREDVRKLATPFLSPEIDPVFLEKYFTGSAFMDLTIHAVTFTYLANQESATNLNLRQVDVYVDPDSQQVTRVYLVKDEGDKTLQLTWKSGSWFSIRKIDGSNTMETKVKWDFHE